MIMKKLTDCYTLINGVTIPCIGFGTWQISNGESAVDAVQKAIDLGYRHIDTAAGYGNEESVGLAIKAAGIPREELFITSKLHNSRRGYEDTVTAFNETMEKLDLEYLDLYLIHWPNPAKYRECWKEMNAESWRAIEDLYKEGRIRAIGISNFLPHHIDALLETATIVPMVNQIRLCPGSIQNEVVAYCREKNMLLEAYSPLATGKVFGVEELETIAAKHNKSVAGICMRFSLHMGFLPLPKTVNKGRMLENADVFDFELTEEEIRVLSELVDKCGENVDPDTATF